MRDLIRDTLAYLQDPLLAKQVLFATAEESAFFQSKQKQVTLPPIAPEPAPATPIFRKAPVKEKPLPLPPQPKEVAPPPPKPVAVQAPSSSPIKKTLQRIAPEIHLTDEVPDDSEAKRVASAWKEKVPEAEVILLACDTDADTLEFLKSLAKAIDQNLAKSKVIAAARLEKEKRWDLFLQKNQFRLIIATAGMQQCSDLMRYYKALPAQSVQLLGETPLLALSSTAIYKNLEHKALLWKTLCQMLKK